MHSIKILIVEDCDEDYEFFAASLPRSWSLVRASTGREALDEFAARTFDLIMFDLHLPDMNGLEVSKLYEEAFDIPSPYVFVSGSACPKELAAVLPSWKFISKDDFLTPRFLAKVLRALDSQKKLMIDLPELPPSNGQKFRLLAEESAKNLDRIKEKAGGAFEFEV